ncbi:C40 family peptidase [Frankia sp. AgKG'84/4]|uniref:C40 family peptidase n=1 Tax=Frankia sp. AgKG'84/4 TaxID=573490 RepID=UPI00200E690C|nr:C40 family peptidase [Frankia sp. AgKG'84/4]MCL9795706.1 C40 family peptidase [Frankia sp. AgKG'84/4]
MTTGTVAVAGVGLAGCATDTHADTVRDESANTAPVALATQIGSRAALGGSIAAAAVSSHGVGGALGTSIGLEAPPLAGKAQVGLRVTNPDLHVAANQPVEVGFSLFNEATHEPLADQLVKVQVKLPTGWATFKHLQTNAQGYASYTARVLTTTNVTAIFDGTDALQSVHSANDATLTVQNPSAAQVAGAVAAGVGAIATPSVNVNVPLPASGIGGKAVYLASLQAGKPYVYGADGPSSFDCSGLVQYVYKQLGKTLPRTTDAQFAATTRVSMYNKQPGDLIFLGTPGNIYHVGIYAGDGKMWVAPHTGSVVKLQSIYTTSYYVGRV